MLDRDALETDYDFGLDLDDEYFRPRLWGFWNERQNKASPPELIVGDYGDFLQDVLLAEHRAAEHLYAISHVRGYIVDEIDEWTIDAAAGGWRPEEG